MVRVGGCIQCGEQGKEQPGYEGPFAIVFALKMGAVGKTNVLIWVPKVCVSPHTGHSAVTNNIFIWHL